MRGGGGGGLLVWVRIGEGVEGTERGGGEIGGPLGLLLCLIGECFCFFKISSLVDNTTGRETAANFLQFQFW